MPLGLGNEVTGRWRLFTKSDLAQSQIDPSRGAMYGPLKRAVDDLGFEHGKEGKLPRANRWRPYRLTIAGSIAAFVVLRASEAFNTCEIDVFEVTEPDGLEKGETTRATLLFALCDAVKSGGSLAIQFRKRIANGAIPDSVVALAKEYEVELSMIDNGTISPEEARSLFLAMVLRSPSARARVLELADRRHASIERICYLVATGIWDPVEANLILACSLYPETIFGSFFDLPSRVLVAHAIDHGISAVTAGLFDRAMRVVSPTDRETTIPIDGANYREAGFEVEGQAGAVMYHSMPTMGFDSWQVPGGDTLATSTGESLLVAPRPRSREALRSFIHSDLEELSSWKSELATTHAILLTSADYLSLAPRELSRIAHTADQLSVQIFACPLSLARLESEVLERLTQGTRVRS